MKYISLFLLRKVALIKKSDSQFFGQSRKKSFCAKAVRVNSILLHGKHVEKYSFQKKKYICIFLLKNSVENMSFDLKEVSNNLFYLIEKGNW
jgi:hypothetical protein